MSKNEMSVGFRQLLYLGDEQKYPSVFDNFLGKQPDPTDLNLKKISDSIRQKSDGLEKSGGV